MHPAPHKCTIEQSESVIVVSKPSKLFKGIDAAQSWHLHRNSQIKVLNSYYIFLGTIAELLRELDFGVDLGILLSTVCDSLLCFG